MTDANKWVRDDEYKMAGRPVGLDDLIAEHKEQLKRRIDEERGPNQEGFNVAESSDGLYFSSPVVFGRESSIDERPA